MDTVPFLYLVQKTINVVEMACTALAYANLKVGA